MKLAPYCVRITGKYATNALLYLDSGSSQAENHGGGRGLFHVENSGKGFSCRGEQS